MPLFPPFIGGSNAGESPVVSIEQTINFYPERSDAQAAKVPQALYPTPGVQTVLDSSKSVGRGLFYQRGRIFGVCDDELYEWDVAGGNILFRGTVADDVDHSPVTITANGDGGEQLFLTASGHGYVFNLSTNTLTEVFTGGATMCGMLDGFVWVLDADSSTLHASDLLDASVFGSSQQRDMAPDPWRAGITVRREIVLIGEHTMEIWYNAGTSPFPFAPHPSGGIGIGIAAPYSLAAIGDGCMWLSQTRDGPADVTLMLGGQPQSVASHALLHALEGYIEAGTRIDDAIADVYTERKHTFYVLTFPTADATWVFDLATGLWHERGRWMSVENRYEAWRPMWHVFAEQKHLWLDRASGKLYEARHDYPNDVDGQPIRRVRRGPHFWLDNQTLIFSRFELLLEPGLGLNVAAGVAGYDPLVELRYSNDDGKTWVSAGTKSAGRIGEYGAEVVWNRLGSSSRRVFEVVMDAPIPWRIYGADVDVRPGMNR